jgi:phosphatidylserine decarboxylase
MRNHTTTQIIAKEGWKYLFFIFVLFLIAFVVNFAASLFFVLFVFTLFVFRNPERLPAEDDELAILAPCDGRIENIEKSNFKSQDMVKITIKKSIFDVSLLRAPTLLNINLTKRRYGLFLPTSSKLSKALGERVRLESKNLFSDVIMIVNAGVLSRKIELFKTVGPLKSSQRFGILVEGSVELYIAIDSRIKVAVGDSIKAGESVLGYFAHKGNESDK